ncbi:MAG: DUF5063 domain-containing protein [Ignavibacteriae bacterium]|nr:DUF5063 domain-containing protein [Ignavibacteriota bacterium]
MDKKSTTRFSGREDNYAKYRPGYPKEMMDWLQSDDVGLWSEDIIADIGMGTGIGTKLFFEAGCTVYGVEPNKEMRERAEQELAGYEKFHSVDGTAENTTLPSGSIDNIVCFQAFHWFDIEKTREEFKRILKSPSCEVFLIWNEHASGDRMKDYDRILEEYCTDKSLIKKSYETVEKYVEPFFAGSGFEKKEFKNVQELDLNALKGRIFSYSDMPAEEEASPEMMKAIQTFYDKHQKDGKVELEYVTRVYYGCIGLAEEDFQDDRIQNFVNAVKKYASTVENYNDYSVIVFLSEVGKDISLIYHTYLALPEIPCNVEDFYLKGKYDKLGTTKYYGLIHEFIGEGYNYYSFIYYPYYKNPSPIVSMLAEDIESIYTDLYPIAEFFDNGNNIQKQDLLFSAQLKYYHWGVHLTSGLHPLNEIIQHYRGIERDEGEDYSDLVFGEGRGEDNVRKSIDEFIGAVRNYCSLVEDYDNYEVKDFFTKVDQLFSKISFTVLALPHIPLSNVPDKDFNGDNGILKGMREKFGGVIYHYSFNPFKKEEPVSNDLILDIFEIYEDLKSEIEKYDNGDDNYKQDALWELQFGYVSHWGRHMAVAQYVIYYYLHDYYWGDS